METILINGKTYSAIGSHNGEPLTIISLDNDILTCRMFSGDRIEEIPVSNSLLQLNEVNAADMALINQLSDEFSRLIVEAFTADQLAETIAKNNTVDYAGCCATHDYCDSNMVMNEAFENVMERAFIFWDDENPETQEQNRADCHLFDSAWMLSKSKNFAVVPCLSDLDANGDIATYSDNEAKRRQLEQEIEVLQTKYDNSTTRNAYSLGGKLRAKQAELAALKGE